MKIVYYTSGVTGSGRLIKGLSIGAAFKRKGIKADYIIVSSCPFGPLAEFFKIPHIEIPPEKMSNLSKERYHESIIYKTLTSLKPDILLTDLLWFPIYNFINEMQCKKIFLYRQVADRFFSIPGPEGPGTEGGFEFRSEDYDLILLTEPFKAKYPAKQINPIIIRNRDEILSRQDALNKLGLSENDNNCLFAFNGHPGEFEEIKKSYSYLENEGHKMIFSTNYKDY